jgi:prepilin-type N-terminal cleavage/methylation domain-containing protein
MKIFHYRSKRSAFSLLEILVSIAIFALLAFATYEITNQSVEVSTTRSRSAYVMNQYRNLMNLIAQDIRSAFLPLNEANLYSDSDTWKNIDLRAMDRAGFFYSSGTPPSLFYDPSLIEGSEENNNREPLRESEFYTGRKTALGSVIPRFQGDGQVLSFIGSNHRRMQRGERVSHFSKIFYFYDPSNQSFNRIEDTDAFRLEGSSEDVKDWPILENVTALQIRYYDWVQERWYNTWDSNSAQTKDRYPLMVEIQFEVLDTREVEGGDNPDEEEVIPFRMVAPITVTQMMMPIQKEVLVTLEGQER